MAARLDSVKDYILKISAGPSYDKLQVVNVNDEKFPVFINNEYFSGYILVRINGFEGITREFDAQVSGGVAGSPAVKNKPKHKPDSIYFKNKNRKYSIVIQGRFKEEYNGDGVLFGVDSSSELMPIPGVWVGIRLCKWLDPALEAHLEGPNPHIYSPIISCMNQLGVFQVGEDLNMGRRLSSDTIHNQTSPTTTNEKTKAIKYHTVESESSTPPLDVTSWAFSSSHVPENLSLLFASQADKDFAITYEKRKKLFASKSKRESVIISPSKIYCMDFYDAYFDLSSFTVKLPGFSINAFKYWDGVQPLRYACKTRDGTRVFFVVQMDLVRRDELGLDRGDHSPVKDV